jgi:hypothetical protein
MLSWIANIVPMNLNSLVPAGTEDCIEAAKIFLISCSVLLGDDGYDDVNFPHQLAVLPSAFD